jgi:two-component system chemotaxis response regulator CheY
MATVLVVDDAAFMRMMLKDILVEAGHRVIGEGETGTEAVQLYATLKPDLVTLDMVMPKKNGMTAAEEILTLDRQARIIVVSSVGQEEIARQALKLGVKAYLLKPFQPDQVKACVAGILAH